MQELCCNEQEYHIIDCDADPFVPGGWQVVEHNKMGQIQWDPAKVTFYHSEKRKYSPISGDMLREELKTQPVLNANILDYLWKNSQLIPKDWKDKWVFFWGTLYNNAGGALSVRCLIWDGDEWCWGACNVVDGFDSHQGGDFRKYIILRTEALKPLCFLNLVPRIRLI